MPPSKRILQSNHIHTLKQITPLLNLNPSSSKTKSKLRPSFIEKGPTTDRC
ncbi:hypothetical protein Hanom_Chr06g00576191 [Helianthus anomalus]